MLVDMVKEYGLILWLKIAALWQRRPPFAWNTDTRETIVLVPGLHESFWFLGRIGNALHRMGFHIVIGLQQVGTEPVAQLADELVVRLQSVAGPVILLGHSKGCLIIKYALFKYPLFAAKVDKVVSISAPFGGSHRAKWLGPKQRELVPGSALLSELNQASGLNHLFLNLYPRFDNHIIPKSSLILAGAKNVEVAVNGHTRILHDDATVTAIGEFLENTKKGGS